MQLNFCFMTQNLLNYKKLPVAYITPETDPEEDEEEGEVSLLLLRLRRD